MERLLRVVFSTIVLVIISASFCLAQAPTVEALREKILKEWLGAADYVAKTTNDKQAKAIMRFTKKHSVPAIPTEDGFIVPEKALKDKKGFGIMVAFESDKETNDDLKNVIDNENVGASFNPDNHILIIRGDVKMSKAWKGLLMIHELAHAHAFLSKPYDWHNVKLFSHEEKKAHEFQNRLTNIMGGPKFVKFINKEVAEIEIPKETNLKTQLIIINNKGLDVSEFFGPTLSEFEEDFRGTSLAIEVNFKLIEKKFKGDIEDKKAVSLFKRYAETGILPDPE